MLICVAFLAANCSTTARVSDGVGYGLLTPSAATRAFIIVNDKPFARQVAAHNLQCQSDKGCVK